MTATGFVWTKTRSYECICIALFNFDVIVAGKICFIMDLNSNISLGTERINDLSETDRALPKAVLR